MISELYIMGVAVDLEEQDFKYILQVNDFFDLKTRQSSFSENITLKKTARNLKIFDLAGTHPNSSNKPYDRLSTDYLIEGVPVVSDAWGFLKKTNKHYNFHFVDGNIDLYRAIEKLKLTDLPMNGTEFTHKKNIESVVATWENDKPYVYAVADYGGLPEYHNAINIDFLVPCISLEWIWNKMFEVTGFQYQISDGVLNNKYFTISDAYKDVSASDSFEAIYNESKFVMAVLNYNESLNKYASFVYHGEVGDAQRLKFTAQESGRYDLSFVCEKQYPYLINDLFISFQIPKLALSINAGSNITSIIDGSVRQYQLNNEGNSYEININDWVVTLEAGDTVDIVAIHDNHTILYNLTGSDSYTNEETNVSFVYKPNASVSLSEYLSDMPLKDLFNEILIQNALTPIVDKKTGVYRFYTLDERLNAPILDWSDKFIRVLNEDYVVGDYGRDNVFSYKYNQEGENHNNGSFEINNAQLKDKEDVKSKFYGAESLPTFFQSLNQYLPEFKLWKEEIKETDNGNEVKYKELKNHYHWLSIQEQVGNVNVKSKAYGTSATASKVKIADFKPFKWQNIIESNYSKLHTLLSRMSLIEVEVKLTPLDIQGFDFFSRIYIKELASVFLPNKIIYKHGEKSKVELIKISE